MKQIEELIRSAWKWINKKFQDEVSLWRKQKVEICLPYPEQGSIPTLEGQGVGPRDEIEGIRQARADLILKRDDYLRRLKAAINRRTGKPLAKATMHAFRKEISKLNKVIEIEDKQIARLSRSDTA